MYMSIYFYRVPRQHVESFLRIQREAAELYRQLGALDDMTLQGHELAAKYGCLAFDKAIELGEDEVAFVGISIFRDQQHHEEVMRLADVHERMNQLYQEVASLVDIGSIIRGEFARVV
ncbi:MAG TPA: DUF1428 family protein [Ktedonosporobacter sp.]|nr:DUF1428 family protein [Ktedonosporobacter sp.]